MNKWLAAGVLAVVSFICILFVLGIATLGVLNTNADLRARAAAQQKANEASFDTVWKILQQKAGVVAQYKEDFKAIWPELIAGRYQSGGSLMKWVQERNPNFDSSLYKDLMVSIESERKEFLRDQKTLIDIKREHDQLRTRPISGFLLSLFGNSSEIEITVVTSGRTNEAFGTGEDNDVELFKKS